MTKSIFRAQALFTFSILAFLTAGFLQMSYAIEDSSAPQYVFTCEPEWAALAKEIGGQHVQTFSATTSHQDPHHVRARPGLISKIRKADMLVCTGADLEIGWLPLLLQRSKQRVQPGQDGYILASDYINLLEKPVRLDRALGDLHAAGNPHLHVNPHNLLTVAKVLTDRLKKADAKNADEYEKNYQEFAARWKKAMERWEKEARPLKGKSVLSHHSSYNYMLDWLGLNLVDTLEPKPGIPPTTGHLKKVLKEVRSQPVLAIIRTPYEPDKASKWLSKKTDIPAITLPYTVEKNKKGDLFSLFDQMIAQLVKADSSPGK